MNKTTVRFTKLDKSASAPVYGTPFAAGADLHALLDENITIASEEEFEAHLDSAHLPDVDLMIRTSGEQRISNFLLWKISYAELYFIDKNWPDFTQKDLQDAINWYKNCKRNFGK